MYGFGLDAGFVTQLWVKPPAEQRVTNPCKHPQLKGAKFFLATTGSCCWGRNRGSSAETGLSRGLWLGSSKLGSAGTRFSSKETAPVAFCVPIKVSVVWQGAAGCANLLSVP